jgi:hypothetical protein
LRITRRLREQGHRIRKYRQRENRDRQRIHPKA